MTTHYRTASFWRYIGEYYAAAQANGRASVTRTAPDYRYLAKIYNNHPFKGPVSAAGDLKWLDNALKEELQPVTDEFENTDKPKKKVRLGLERLYPNFISTFAAYMPARLTMMEKLHPSKLEVIWLNYLFESCPTVTLSDKHLIGVGSLLRCKRMLRDASR